MAQFFSSGFFGGEGGPFGGGGSKAYKLKRQKWLQKRKSTTRVFTRSWELKRQLRAKKSKRLSGNSPLNITLIEVEILKNSKKSTLPKR